MPCQRFARRLSQFNSPRAPEDELPTEGEVMYIYLIYIWMRIIINEIRQNLKIVEKFAFFLQADNYFMFVYKMSIYVFFLYIYIYVTHRFFCERSLLMACHAICKSEGVERFIFFPLTSDNAAWRRSYFSRNLIFFIGWCIYIDVYEWIFVSLYHRLMIPSRVTNILLLLLLKLLLLWQIIIMINTINHHPSSP